MGRTIVERVRGTSGSGVGDGAETALEPRRLWKYGRDGFDSRDHRERCRGAGGGKREEEREAREREFVRTGAVISSRSEQAE